MNTERSKKLFEEANKVLPGGVSSPVRAIKPYPFYTGYANGSRITDIDGNEYIDYVMGYGPLLLGHNHPAIKEAVIKQLSSGWLYGTPTELEVALAREIIKLYTSIEMVRFVSTGTEATMGALRIARGFTKKNKFIKIEGGFHGAHDAALVKAGSGATTLGTPDSAGVPLDFTKNTLQVPYNDIEAMTSSIEAYRDDVAAVIIEPVLGNIGPIIPKKGYLEDIRAVTEENDVVLIFDEVITGFRLAMGGAQEYYGVTPDMTTLGKILGGGFHIGVIGGKREIMENVSPAGAVYQAGTFNGSPVSMASGLAVIDTLKREKVHEKVNRTGDLMRIALTDIVADLGLAYSVSGVSSMFKVFFGDMPYNYQDALRCDKEKFNSFFKRMLSDGIFLPPSQYETNFLSLAHSQDDIDKTIKAYQRNLK
ncbi:glutamate-1-semialdehyde 2,1-aminomutase [Candidatus Methanoperedens nitroreducens]|uniref:Glutamate-1-semialdehyde 2,1-aminomutase n=1 Tax=Candidatus Methanoperedens nitratireducens TaxID=1392998 RepID=A0A062VB62_9EURY|nr:glutamate-1-semialdehyde 2,1-aminomutase [Candidatus Methanoperedens nitroreducens]KCZ72555.1 glutamate-1-semialdehyde 2,1-aminomutase [Candidatus Methanoperedens nitroreducens]MDJ1423512.1 glutamate-1-semialdehyde 2,1-aminomutase [Candidatus Methanoperedens sp.]